jgi:hypothetical protein
VKRAILMQGVLAKSKPHRTHRRTVFPIIEVLNPVLFIYNRENGTGTPAANAWFERLELHAEFRRFEFK